MIGWINRLRARLARFLGNREPRAGFSLAALFAELERESNQLVEDEIRRCQTQSKTTGR
jgi:hypothetical protein